MSFAKLTIGKRPQIFHPGEFVPKEGVEIERRTA
jgi:hypothetical protein